MLTLCSRSQAIRFGARSLWLTAMAIGSSATAWFRSREICSVIASRIGPNNGPNTSAEKIVRRSRRFSKNSLRNTVSSRRIMSLPRA
jgi:hypothetical protein